jgi:ankyrin repeat protein
LRYSPTAGYETTVRLLLQHGANPNSKEYGITPLIAASQFGHKDVAKILTKEGGAIVSDGQSLDRRALHAALSNREGEMADFLLEEGVSLGGYDLDNNRSIDQLQDGQSHTLTQRLIGQRPKPDTSDILYGMLLRAAAAAGAEAIVRLLV